jgi:hypothetical protein
VQFLEELRERMRRFSLELHPDKTRHILLGRFATKRRMVQGNGKPETPFERNTPLAARLVVKKLPPEQATQARARAKKRRSKSQKKGSDLAIRLAGYVVLLTTVPESDLSNEQLLKTYQLRWYIELFFKRCKSLLGLDELRAGGRVAHSWFLGKTLIAALIDRKLVQLQQETNGGTPSNLWRLTALCPTS